MYTHTNHTRALTFDLEFERNTVKPRRSPRQFPLRRGRGFSCSFFPPRSLSLFLPLTRVSSSRGQKIFVFFFFFFFYDLDGFQFSEKRARRESKYAPTSVVFIPRRCGRPETIYQSVSLFSIQILLFIRTYRACN